MLEPARPLDAARDHRLGAGAQIDHGQDVGAAVFASVLGLEQVAEQSG
jgi:hypothetical protein